MSDVLSSILGSMEKPPGIPDKDRQKSKVEAEKLKVFQAKERKLLEKFRKEIQDVVSGFVNDPMKTRHSCKPMNKLQRTIVHEAAEDAGLTSQAFGVEDVDRYVMLMKKEHPASEDEITAYRNGEVWNGEENARRKINQQEEILNSDEPCTQKPSSNYKDKYNHLIGSTSAKEAARKTEANASFGMVPSTNKRDLRSIEETLNEIRAKRTKKTQTS